MFSPVIIHHKVGKSDEKNKIENFFCSIFKCFLMFSHGTKRRTAKKFEICAHTQSTNFHFHVMFLLRDRLNTKYFPAIQILLAVGKKVLCAFILDEFEFFF